MENGKTVVMVIMVVVVVVCVSVVRPMLVVGQWSAGGRDKVSRTLSLLFLSISFRVNRLTASNQKYFSLFY